MLTEMITMDRIQLVKSIACWQQAIRLAAAPLVSDGSITEGYVDAMIDIVNKYGPYIVLSPGLAIPHARPESGVNRTAMSFLKVEEKVYFGDEKYANVFFVLACNDGTSHMDALKEMAEVFSDVNALDTFLGASGREEIAEILKKYSSYS